MSSAHAQESHSLGDKNKPFAPLRTVLSTTRFTDSSRNTGEIEKESPLLGRHAAAVQTAAMTGDDLGMVPQCNQNVVSSAGSLGAIEAMRTETQKQNLLAQDLKAISFVMREPDFR